MSDHDPPVPVAGEEPPQPDNNPATPDGGAQPRSDDAPAPPDERTPSEQLAEIDDEEKLSQLLFGQGEDSPESPPSANPPIETPDKAPAPVAGEEPEPTAPTDADESPIKGPERISLRALSPADRTLMAEATSLVKDGKAASISEALASLVEHPADPDAGTPTPADEDKGTEPAAPDTDPIQDDDPVSTLTAELDALRADRRKANEEYDADAVMDLTEQIEDKIAERTTAKGEAAQRLVDQDSWDQAIDDNVAEVRTKYPDANDPQSEFFQSMGDAIDLAIYRNDPILQDPNYNMLIAAKVAASLGQGPAPVAGDPPPAPIARPIGQVSPAGSTPTPTPEQASELIRGLSAEQLGAALGFPTEDD